jgi:elongation factor P
LKRFDILLYCGPMAMLDYNEIKERKVIMYEGAPYEVLSSWVFRKQQRKPVNATKIKNLLTGRVAEVSFHVSEKVEEAELGKRKVKFLFENKGELMFAEENDPAKRFPIPKEKIGTPAKFLTPNMTVDLVTFEDEDEEEIIVGVSLPIKMTFTIKEAPPAIKGSTASGSTKIAVLESGTTVNVPMFFEAGDKIIVNTETGDYVERG